MRYFSLGLYALLLIFANAAWAGNGKDILEISPRNVVNQNFTNTITLNDIQNQPHSLSKLEGKPVLLNFWAIWCGSCRREMPALVDFSESYGEDITVITIATGSQNWQEMQKFALGMGLKPHQIWRDKQGEMARNFGVSALPHSVILDENLQAVGQIIGTQDFMKPEFLENLWRILETR